MLAWLENAILGPVARLKTEDIPAEMLLKNLQPHPPEVPSNTPTPPTCIVPARLAQILPLINLVSLCQLLRKRQFMPMAVRDVLQTLTIASLKSYRQKLSMS